MNQPHPRRKSDARSFSGTPSASRRLLERLLHGRRGGEATSRGRLLLEPLEQRQMMAGDVQLFATDPAASSETFSDPGLFQTTSAEGENAAEGEAADDLVAFAEALSDAGVTFFGAAWCPACLEQKKLFGDGKEELPFVEVTNPDRTLNQVGEANDIDEFPTWEFPDGTRATGVLTLEQISQRSGVAIPQSDQPQFAPIGNQTVEIGAPLHIPIDAYDPDDDSLTVTVAVANPSLLTASVLQGNRSARISVQGWGDMVFELFEDRAPRAAERFIELAESGFYDASEEEKVIFHRIIDNFVLQAGDPTGTGSGGSTLGDFDDNFHPELQHNRTGILSYAKSLDDTNDSQFFITEGPQRHLDFNHSVFGQLVEGEVVREAISETKTTSSRPDVPVVIDKVEIFNDTQNSILMLKPTGQGTGSTDVTITVTDGEGNVFTEVITVTVVADAVNAAPYLEDIDPVSTPAGTPAVIDLEGVDLEGDPVTYEARVVGDSGATVAVDQATGRVTVTPAQGFAGGIIWVEVAVRSSSTPTSTNASTRSATMDLELVPVNVGPAAPTGLTLNSASDSGLSNSDRITNTTPLTFTVTGVTPGATVELVAGETQVGVGTATGSTVTITTNNFAALGNAVHAVSARQTVGGVRSAKSPAVSVTFDTVAPSLSPAIPSQASVGVPYVGNLQNTEEGSGLRYAVASGPAGLTIDAANGQITWTPTASQVGDQTLEVTLTDAAGNSRQQSYAINVGSDPLVTIRLEAVDLSGNVITSLAPGQEFKVNVYGNDERTFTPQGVYALYTDLIFNGNLAEVVENNPFEYAANYSSGRLGTASFGLVDEVGSFSDRNSSIGPDEQRVFSVRMRALSGGNLIIAADPADGQTAEVLLFGSDEEVLPSRVVYGSLALTINSTFNAVADTATVAEDSSDTAIPVLANDTILVTGTTLTLVSASQTTAGGTVEISGGNVLYTPPENFTGADQFTYTVRDQNGSEQTATVNVTVTAVNDPPNAVNDTFEVVKGSTQNQIDVIANDSSNPDANETLRVTAVGSTSKGGTVTIASGGTHVVYTPPANFTGTDTFTYTLSDGSLTDTATVTISVVPGNPPPTVVGESFTINEDSAAADHDVLANDSTADPDETISLHSVGSTSNGTVSIAGGKLRYKPNADFFGTDLVTYTVRDSNGATAIGTVTFTVNAANDPPPAPELAFNAVKGSSEVKVLDVAQLNAVNVDGAEVLTITAVSTTSAGGTITISSNKKSVFYTPPTSGFTGTDTFTYTVSDASGATATGTQRVNVLDYVPRDLALKLNTQSVSSATMLTVNATLVGTDYTGAAVSTQASFDRATGTFRFADQAPGTYEIVLPAVPFLRNGQAPQRLAVVSEFDDTEAVEVEATLGNLLPQYVSIRDFLGSTPKASVFAIVRTGESHTWLVATNGSATPANPVVSLSANGQQVTVEVDGSGGSRRRATLPITDARIDVRASEGEYRLLRINVATTAITYTPVTSSSSASTASNAADESSAEGETAQTAAAHTAAAQTAAAQTLSTQSPSTQAPIHSSAPTTPTQTTPTQTSSTQTSSTQAASTQAASTRIATPPPAEGEAPAVLAAVADTSAAAADAAGSAASASSASPLVPEGEPTPPVQSPISGLQSPPVAAVERSADTERVGATEQGEASSFASSTDSQRPAAVDLAMLDLLPQLQLRSTTADALAEPEDPRDLSAVDRTFDLLGG